MKAAGTRRALAAATRMRGRAAAPRAQPDPASAAAARAADSAQALQAAGRWPEAQAQLDDAAGRCVPAAPGRPCRLLLAYSLAFLAEREAHGRPDLRPEARAELLALAEARYRAVLSESPQHEPTLRNLVLVYRELGREAEAERLLQDAAASARGGEAWIALLLGRYYRETGRFDEALAVLDRATAANPGDPAAPQAIVALHADGDAARLLALLPRLDAWAATLPAVAAEGYRLILRGLPGTAPQAERALLPWVSLIARHGWLAPGSFDGLPRGWPPLDELMRYAASPEQAPSGSGWWMQQPLRRSVLAELAPATARAPEARAEPARALRRLRSAMQFCPPYEDYLFRAELRSAWPARLELARAMLGLLSAQPALDPGGQQQRALINELFAGKAGAYASEDLVAMQRFHTTLGRWYAERGEWTGGGATNARFQLEHALGAAERRQRRGEAYQPMAEEKALLAAGYLTLGEPARARAMQGQAAAAYLDGDQLEPARAALDAALRLRSPEPSAAERERTELLRRVLVTRERLAEGGSTAGAEARPEAAWLRGEAGDAFVQRQRFKVLADLASQARAAGDADAAAQRAAASFGIALDLPSLVGAADLVRLDTVKALATARAQLADRRTALVSARAPAGSPALSLGLYVPAQTQPVFVQVSGDAALAGRVDAQLRRDPRLAGQALQYRVEGGDLTVYVPGGANEIAEAVRQMPRVRGLRGLNVAPY